MPGSCALVLFFRALILHQVDQFGLDSLAGFQTAAVADNHRLALLQSGKNFGVGGGLDAEHDLPRSILLDESTTSTLV